MKNTSVKKIILIIIVLLSAGVMFGQEKTDDLLIKQVIQDAYVDGLCNNADEEAIYKGFHKDFKLTGIGRDNSVWEFPISDWIEMAKKGKEKGYKYSFQDEYTTVKFISIDISGNVAVAKIEFYEGQSLNFIDYLSLMKFDEGWKIVSKIFYPVPKPKRNLIMR